MKSAERYSIVWTGINSYCVLAYPLQQCCKA